MGDHDTWFHLFGWYSKLEHWAEPIFARQWRWKIFRDTHFSMAHVVIALLVVVLLSLAALRYSAALRGNSQDRLVPDEGFQPT